MRVDRTSDLSRRELFRRIGLGGLAAAALPELSRVLLFQRTVLAQSAVLTAAESNALAAACARIIPTDENGPGATEARASQYIERGLAGFLASSKDAYKTGLAGLDRRSQASHRKSFPALTPSEQDAVLTETEKSDSEFFGTLRTHTIQGTFCDPAYGGNADFVGWDLIAYPGLRLNVTADDQRMGTPAKPMRRSAYDYAMFAKATM